LAITSLIGPVVGIDTLIDLHNGETIHQWSDIDSGKQTSSITWDKLPPQIALDAPNGRFAVGQDESIRVIQIDVNLLEGYVEP